MTIYQATPMTVMFIIDLLGPFGGAERSLNLLARGLIGHGHRIIICCLKGGESYRKLEQEGFYVENLNIDKLYNADGLRALSRLIKLVRQERVSAIMTYHESSDFFGILISMLTRTPIISNRRDMGFKLKLKHIWLYRLINRFFDGIVAVSYAVKEAVLKTQWAKTSNVVVIHNGVDLSSSSDGASICTPDKAVYDECLNVCCLANIRQIKGHKYLIKAAKLAVERFPNVRFHFIGCYDMDDAYFKDIQKQIQTLQIQDTINFIGEIRHVDVSTMFAAIDISVLPSLSEGLSNTLLESMLAGKPVVATAVGGNPEVVEDGKSGFLVPPRDPHAMAEAILKLLGNSELRREMGHQGRMRVQEEFSVGGMVEKYEDILRYVTEKKNRGL
ncbi:MAG: glycosyltransferase [Tissierellales bacterium]|nr:glycosyltransferase [Tissierellales bacterium]